MIVYFDTSAVVPLLVEDEPGTETCRRAWSLAESVVTCRLLYVEAAAALARATRMDRLTSEAHERALSGLDELWAQLDVLEVTGPLIDHAARLARRHDLRGYDAVHCAAAQSMAGTDITAVSGDRSLLAAWRADGIAIIDTNT